MPGVQNVAVQSQSPFEGAGRRETFTIEGQPDPGPRNGHAAYWNRVGGDFFRALGIAIVRGRGLRQPGHRKRSAGRVGQRDNGAALLAERRRHRQAASALLRHGLAAVAVDHRDRARSPLQVRRVDAADLPAAPAASLPLAGVYAQNRSSRSSSAPPTTRPGWPQPCRRPSGPSTRINPS